MTEAPAPAQQPELSEFLQTWSASLSQVVGQITGSPVPCTLQAEAPSGTPPTVEVDLWALVTCSGSVRGEMSFRLPGTTVLRLAQIFMSEPATPEAQPSADHRDAVIELLRQVSGIVSTAAKGRWGDIQILVELGAAAPSWTSGGSFWLLAGDEGPAAMVLEAALSAALVAELRAEKPEVPKAESVKVATDSAPPNRLTDSQQSAGALDMLMDVQLAMTMRFGARRMLLREVLDLGPGSVIELDKKIQEPVDLLLDGRLVARGEVVVIDGSYGLRVTDVSPLQAD